MMPRHPDGDPGTYNQFWWEEGGFLNRPRCCRSAERPHPAVDAGRRARRRAEQRRAATIAPTIPEERNLAERCITRSAPKLPGGYNNNFQIVQTPQYMMHLPGDDSRGADHPARRTSARAQSTSAAISATRADAGKATRSSSTRRTSGAMSTRPASTVAAAHRSTSRSSNGSHWSTTRRSTTATR